jgi:hypothetical protein
MVQRSRVFCWDYPRVRAIQRVAPCPLPRSPPCADDIATANTKNLVFRRLFRHLDAGVARLPAPGRSATPLRRS